MTRYWLYRKQDGQGCDYTIGCGERLTPMSATNELDAAEEAVRAFKEPGNAHAAEGEYERAMVLVEVADLMPAIEIILDREAEEMAEAERERKRKQLAKLKQELGE